MIEEAYEAVDAFQAHDDAHMREELGDVLFSAVNIARFLGTDAEEALTFSNDKFIRRYLLVEKLAAERCVDMKSTPLDELDKLWKEAKEQLESN